MRHEIACQIKVLTRKQHIDLRILDKIMLKLSRSSIYHPLALDVVTCHRPQRLNKRLHFKGLGIIEARKAQLYSLLETVS